MAASSVPASSVPASDGIAGLTVDQLDQLDQLVEARRQTQRAALVERYGPRIGGVMLPAGLILIGFGWYGAAHTPFTFEQTPYLISGGLLGLAMTIAGALLYFGSLLVQLGERNRAAAARLSAQLEAVRSHGAGVATNGRSELVATTTGSMAHRRDCSVVKDRSHEELRAVTLDESGIDPCKLCQPAAA